LTFYGTRIHTDFTDFHQFFLIYPRFIWRIRADPCPICLSRKSRTNQHFHPGNATDEHALIAGVFRIGSNNAIQRVNDLEKNAYF
jgi:hypothetical protein